MDTKVKAHGVMQDCAFLRFAGWPATFNPKLLQVGWCECWTFSKQFQKKQYVDTYLMLRGIHFFGLHTVHLCATLQGEVGEKGLPGFPGESGLPVGIF